MSQQTYIHPFPARMAPEIALREVTALPTGSIVVDPMVGSGTTVRTASLCGHTAFGFDVDPLAVKVARSESSHLNARSLLRAGEDLLKSLERLDRRHLRRYPVHFDDETKDYADRWFPRYNQTALTYLAEMIADVRDPNLRNALEVALSGTIIVKQSGCSFARDVAHSRPHYSHELTPRRVEVLFEKRLLRTAGIYRSRSRPPGHAQVRLGDARQLPLANGSADMVITSPPYLNALDYMRGHRMSLIWLGHNIATLRATRSHSIGTENTDGLAFKGLTRTQAIYQRYVIDLEHMLTEVHRVLRPSGHFVCVIGDNKPTNGRSNALLIVECCEKLGMPLEHRKTRRIPSGSRYLPPPSTSTGTALAERMARESILTFKKTCQI